MEMALSQAGDRVVLSIRGDLDFATREVFEAELRRLMERSKVIEVNMAELQFIDSSGVGALLTCWEDARESEVTLLYRQAAPDLMEIFDLLGVREVLPFD